MVLPKKKETNKICCSYHKTVMNFKICLLQSFTFKINFLSFLEHTHKKHQQNVFIRTNSTFLYWLSRVRMGGGDECERARLFHFFVGGAHPRSQTLLSVARPISTFAFAIPWKICHRCQKLPAAIDKPKCQNIW